MMGGQNKDLVPDPVPDPMYAPPLVLLPGPLPHVVIKEGTRVGSGLAPRRVVHPDSKRYAA